MMARCRWASPPMRWSQGDQALIYDTHVSRAHAAAIRGGAGGARACGGSRSILATGISIMSPGTAEFPGCEVIANGAHRRPSGAAEAAIEAGTSSGCPAIAPLIAADAGVSRGRWCLHLGEEEVHLIEANIHSDDATVLWLPARRLLFAGDTLEDTLTYVAEPQGFAAHLRDLDRLAALAAPGDPAQSWRRRADRRADLWAETSSLRRKPMCAGCSH